MRTLTELLPLGIGVAIVGIVTWFLLDRGWPIGPWLLGLLLFAHGWVHLLFVFPKPQPAAATADGPAWPFDMTRSWLITGAGLDVGLVRTLGVALMAIVFVAFLLAALSTVNVLVPVGWWPGLVIGSAVGSALLLAAFFSPTLLLGFGVDAALLWLVLASVWSPTAGGIPG